jgi:hypothetical protein
VLAVVAPTVVLYVPAAQIWQAEPVVAAVVFDQ